MAQGKDEEGLLRSVALQNAQSILLARQRAEEELVRAKEALELRSQELARTLAMMRATLESSTDGILVTDDDGRVMVFNEKFVEMWRIPREILDTRDHRQVLEATCRAFEDPQQFLARIDEIYASPPPDSYDLLELADGRVLERFSRIQFVEERDVGRVWTFRDITDRRRAQRALEREKDTAESDRARAEAANRAKDEFLAMISHELRTPLNSMLGWMRLIRSGRLDDETMERGLETIERNTLSQAQLIEDLLDISRVITGKLSLAVEQVEVDSVIQTAVDSVRLAAEARDIKLQMILDSSAGVVSGDRGRLQQVIWNLLSNAIKFTPKRGRVRIQLERVGSSVEITVSDSGKGISPEFLPYVFDRFRQADAGITRTHGGLGLGLSIVRHLVELHGGTVRAESEGEDKGATFVVQLPVAPVRRDRAKEKGPRTHGTRLGGFECPPELTGVRVLVVDDEVDTRAMLAVVLGQCEADVRTVSSASEALATLDALDGWRPDLLVSDIGMPDEDGYALIKRIRARPTEHGGGIPAVALTAYARLEDRMQALAAGFQIHVAKPVEPAELILVIRSLLDFKGRT
jgi:PAS domain S-box-containing protein